MADIKEEKKVSYEELEVRYKATVETARKIVAENNEMKELNKELMARLNYNEIGFAFKVLEFRELFSKEFVAKVINKLEEILTPGEPDKEEEK